MPFAPHSVHFFNIAWQSNRQKMVRTLCFLTFSLPHVLGAIQWRPQFPSPKNMSIFDVKKTNPLRTSFLLSGALPASLFSMLFRDPVLSPQLGPCCFVPLPLYIALSQPSRERNKNRNEKIVKLKLIENELNYLLNQKKPTLTLCFFFESNPEATRNSDMKLKSGLSKRGS